MKVINQIGGHFYEVDHVHAMLAEEVRVNSRIAEDYKSRIATVSSGTPDYFHYTNMYHMYLGAAVTLNNLLNELKQNFHETK